MRVDPRQLVPVQMDTVQPTSTGRAAALSACCQVSAPQRWQRTRVGQLAQHSHVREGRLVDDEQEREADGDAQADLHSQKYGAEKSSHPYQKVNCTPTAMSHTCGDASLGSDSATSFKRSMGLPKRCPIPIQMIIIVDLQQWSLQDDQVLAEPMAKH